MKQRQTGSPRDPEDVRGDRPPATAHRGRPARGGRPPGYRQWSGVLLLLLAGWLPVAQAQPAPEQTVKAAYLYNFAKFVRWPARAFLHDDAPLELCVLGDDPLVEALRRVEGKTVQGHPMALQSLPRVAVVRGCHILFVGRSQRARLPQVLNSLDGQPVLTVSDIRGFASAGGIIGLTQLNQRIGVVVNVDAARRARLKISSKLLRLAQIVGEPSAGAGQEVGEGDGGGADDGGAVDGGGGRR